MSVTFGFYNSNSGDRRYDAVQMSSIFDGIIRDGVFQHIGTALMVKELQEMIVSVGIGRAWFNHTWTLNDALLPLTVPISEVVLNRIDAVVLEVDARESVRANSIKIVKGTPASNPVRPAMIKTNDRWQYPLAYIRVNSGVTAIRQADITNCVGTSACPFVTAPLEIMSVDALVAQWGDQWQSFYGKQTADMEQTNDFWKAQWRTWFQAQTTEIQEAYLNWEHQWDEWYAAQTSDMSETNKYWKDLWQAWFYDYVNNSTKELAYWKKLVSEDWQSFYGKQTADMEQTNDFWKAQWRTWFQAQTTEIQEAYLNWEHQWDEWYAAQTSDMSETNKYWKDLWQAWFYDYVNNSTKEYSDWKTSIDSDFRDWWDSLKELLVGNPDAKFAAELLDLQNRLETLEDFMTDLSNSHSINDSLADSSSNGVTDNSGDRIKCRKMVFLTERSLGISADDKDLATTVRELAKRTDALEQFTRNLAKELTICDILLDGGAWLFNDNENAVHTEQILDCNGTAIDGRVILVVK